MKAQATLFTVVTILIVVFVFITVVAPKANEQVKLAKDNTNSSQLSNSIMDWFVPLVFIMILIAIWLMLTGKESIFDRPYQSQ